MNDKIADNIDLITKKLIEATEKTVDFGSDQIPILIQEILNWGVVSNSLDCLMALFFIIIGIYGIKKTYPVYKQLEVENELDSIPFAFGLMGLGAVSVIGVFSLFCNFSLVLKVLFAPRLYLLEYLSTLIK